MRFLRNLLVGGVLALTLAQPVSAADSISLDQTGPHYQDYVTFTTVIEEHNIKNPRIEVDCYRDGELIFGMGGAIDYAFQLGGAGSIWVYEYPNTPADCTATLFYFGKEKGQQTFVPLAEVSFHVEG